MSLARNRKVVEDHTFFSLVLKISEFLEWCRVICACGASIALSVLFCESCRQVVVCFLSSTLEFHESGSTLSAR